VCVIVCVCVCVYVCVRACVCDGVCVSASVRVCAKGVFCGGGGGGLVLQCGARPAGLFSDFGAYTTGCRVDGRKVKPYVPDPQFRQSAPGAHGEGHGLPACKKTKTVHASYTRAQLTLQGQEKHKEWEACRPGGEEAESAGKSFAAKAKK